MAEYGVSVTNLFDLLGDGDGSPAPKKTDGKKKAEQKVKHKGNDRSKAPRSAAASTGNRNSKRVFDRRSGTGRGKEGSKGGHGRGNWGSGGEDDREQRRGPNYNDRRSNDRRNDRNERGPRRNDGERSSRRNDGDRAPRRNNDRRNDRRNNDRRNDDRNNDRSAPKPAEEATTGEDMPTEETPTEETAGENKTAAFEEEEKEPEEAPTFTLEEYQQKIKENAVEGDVIVTRQAENDDKKWGQCDEVVAAEPDEVENKYNACVKAKVFRKKGKGKKKATKMNIDEFAAGKTAKRGQRGQRGRGAGGRGRGNASSAKPTLSDASAFPSLGGK